MTDEPSRSPGSLKKTHDANDEALGHIGPWRWFIGMMYGSARASRNERERREEEARLYIADAQAEEAYIRAQETATRVSEELAMEKERRLQALAEARTARQRAERAEKRLDDEERLAAAEIEAKIAELERRKAGTIKTSKSPHERALEKSKRIVDEIVEEAQLDEQIERDLQKQFATLDDRAARGELSAEDVKDRKERMEAKVRERLHQ